MILARARRWESVLARSLGGGSREGWKEPTAGGACLLFTGQVVVFLVAGAWGLHYQGYLGGFWVV